MSSTRTPSPAGDGHRRRLPTRPSPRPHRLRFRRSAAQLAVVATLATAGGITAAVTGASIAGAAGSATGVTVSVDAGQTLATLSPLAVGQNAAVYDGHLLDDGLPGQLKEAGVNVLRYPGGSIGDTWHWKDNTVSAGYANPANTFDAFMGVATKTGAQPMLIANYGGGTAAEAADWVRYANVTKHYNAKYWEVGNEVYGNGVYGANWENDQHADKSPAEYGRNAADYITQMKAVDPSIKVGVVMTTPGNWPDGVVQSGASKDWNNTVLPLVADKADFLIIHWYPNSSSADELMRQTAQLPGMVAKLRDLVRQYAPARADQIQIMLTEVNSNYQLDNPISGAWAPDAVVTALENGITNVDWWNIHNGAKKADKLPDGSIDFGDEGFLSNASCNGGQCEPPVGTPFPSYYGLQMITRLAGPGDRLVKATSSAGPVRVHAARRAGGGLSVMLVNTDAAQSYDVNLGFSGYTPTGAPTVTTYAKGASGPVAAQGGGSTVSVGPWSVTTVEYGQATSGGGTPTGGPTAPPTSVPPVTTPPATVPPVTTPPATVPPVTTPPVTAPPVTPTPTAAPPTTAPPGGGGQPVDWQKLLQLLWQILFGSPPPS